MGGNSSSNWWRPARPPASRAFQWHGVRRGCRSVLVKLGRASAVANGSGIGTAFEAGGTVWWQASGAGSAMARLRRWRIARCCRARPVAASLTDVGRLLLCPTRLRRRMAARRLPNDSCLRPKPPCVTARNIHTPPGFATVLSLLIGVLIGYVSFNRLSVRENTPRSR